MRDFNLKAGCKTTAMAIMPHKDINRALELALSLDIPFWPQLPRLNFYEDMYFQAAQNFPGMIIDMPNQTIKFNTEKFKEELAEYSENMLSPETFAPDPEHSKIYYEFLSKDLKDYPAIRGQVSGPVNLGYRINDEDLKPMVYNDEVRTLLFDFIQRKANLQYHQLRKKNPNAFVWLDEPGIIWAFSGLSGYNDMPVKQDYHSFLEGIEGIKALHLCSNVNLPYLLELGAEFVSFDAYQLETMPGAYSRSVAGFLKNEGIICWGLVPTEPTLLNRETPESLADRLLGYWQIIAENTSLDPRQIAEQALIAPAKCCVKSAEYVGNPLCQAVPASDSTIEVQSVEKAFTCLKIVSKILKSRFSLK